MVQSSSRDEHETDGVRAFAPAPVQNEWHMDGDRGDLVIKIGRSRPAAVRHRRDLPRPVVKRVRDSTMRMPSGTQANRVTTKPTCE